MNTLKTIGKFIAQHKTNWKDGRYYHLTLALLFELDLPKTEECGFACMKMLEFTTISLNNGYVIDDSFDNCGTIENIAKMIALIFADVNDDPEWWMANYPDERTKPETATLSEELATALLDLESVVSINIAHDGHTEEEMADYEQRIADTLDLDGELQDFQYLWTTEKDQWKLQRFIKGEMIFGYAIVTQTEDNVLSITGQNLKAKVIARLLNEGIRVDDIDLSRPVGEILSLEEAKARALEFLRADLAEDVLPVEITHVYEKSYGYIFSYNTKKYLETHNWRDSLIGVSLVLIEYGKQANLIPRPLELRDHQEIIDWYDKHRLELDDE